jgi:hypothetical protein
MPDDRRSSVVRLHYRFTLWPGGRAYCAMLKIEGCPPPMTLHDREDRVMELRPLSGRDVQGVPWLTADDRLFH